jgi:6-phosphofructokinase 2
MISKDECVQLISPEVKRISTVGAGDSMVAGIVKSLSENISFKDAAKYGVACGSAATINPGTELCKKSDADQIYKQITEIIFY